LNTLDIFLLIIIATCAIVGYGRGFIHMVYRLVSFGLALFLARAFYPYVARMLRGTGVFYGIRDFISRTMGFGFHYENFALIPREEPRIDVSQLINDLPLPEALRGLIYANDTLSMREALGARNVEEYVSGFMANMVINVLAMIVVFMVIMLILNFIGVALNIVARLPVINFLNRTVGLLAGSGIGILLAWIFVSILIVVVSTSGNIMVYELLQESRGAGVFLEGEWLLPVLAEV